MMNLIPLLFHAIQGVTAAVAKSTAHERALYTEVLHNCAWLDALTKNAKANDPRFVDAIASLHIEAHEAFLEGQFGEDDTIAVKTLPKGAKTIEKLRLGTREIPITLELEDEEEHQEPHNVILAQAVAYVVHQVMLMRTVAKSRKTLGDLLVNMRGGTRTQNLRRVEHAIQMALVDSNQEIAPRAGAKGAKSPK